VYFINKLNDHLSLVVYEVHLRKFRRNRLSPSSGQEIRMSVLYEHPAEEIV
jgi:hypothetical protein